MSSVSLSPEVVNDLANRWLKARLAGVAKATAVVPKLESEVWSSLVQCDDEKYEEILKAVFLNSRNLGVSFQKAHHLVWDLADIQQHFGQLNSPCLQGAWSEAKAAKTLRRSGCRDGASHGGRFCQYWREAIDGLVAGLCDEEHFVRHECINAGNEQCVDVFYEESKSISDERWNNQNRWGTIPQDKRESLVQIEEKFKSMKVDLQFLGSLEGRLFYKMTSKENLACGSGGGVLRTYMEKHVREVWAGIELQDASPVAVYGEKA